MQYLFRTMYANNLTVRETLILKRFLRGEKKSCMFKMRLVNWKLTNSRMPNFKQENLMQTHHDFKAVCFVPHWHQSSGKSNIRVIKL